MEHYMGEKWKPSKDHPRSYSSTTSMPYFMISRSTSQKSSTSKSPLLRSFSQKSSSYKSPLSRSCSQKSSSNYKSPAPLSGTSSSLQKSSSSKSPLSRSSSQKCSNFARKFGSLAKEQRARFYIMKRCVTMLVCWHKHGDC